MAWVCLQIPEAIRLEMLVLRAQMCFETQRCFCSLEKKKKIGFPDSTINQVGKPRCSGNSVNSERTAERAIHLARLPQRRSQGACRHLITMFISFLASDRKLEGEEMLMKQRPRDCYTLQSPASQGETCKWRQLFLSEPQQ